MQNEPNEQSLERLSQNMNSVPLTDEERETYAWQMDVRDFGEAGQQKLKGASVLISRVGGLGSVVAYELAAAGIGRLILERAAVGSESAVADDA